MASKYETKIVLCETGEDLREDTQLRFQSVIAFLAGQIESESKRAVALKMAAFDIRILSERINGVQSAGDRPSLTENELSELLGDNEEDEV